MPKQITITGAVGKTITSGTSKHGQPNISFQLAVGEPGLKGALATTWHTVNAFRQLAANAARSVKMGDRLIVTGAAKDVVLERTRTRLTRTVVTVERMGHGMFWGTSEFTRGDGRRAAAQQA